MEIYCIKNNIDNKVYIGLTSRSIQRRYPGGFWKSPANNYLRSAITKYSKDNFSIQTLIKCDSKESLNYWERYYINLYNSCNPAKGYNFSAGGYTYEITEELKKIRSKATKKYINNNPEELVRLNEINHNYWNNPESRIKKSEQMKQICSSKAKRLKMALIQGSKLFGVFTKESDEYVGDWINKSECAEELFIDSRKICACLSGHRKSHKGLVFRYY